VSRRPPVVYCRDCDEGLCEACFIRLHNGHHHSSVDEVVGELRHRLQDDASKLVNISLDCAERFKELQIRYFQC